MWHYAQRFPRNPLIVNCQYIHQLETGTYGKYEARLSQSFKVTNYTVGVGSQDWGKNIS